MNMYFVSDRNWNTNPQKIYKEWEIILVTFYCGLQLVSIKIIIICNTKYDNTVW